MGFLKYGDWSQLLFAVGPDYLSDAIVEMVHSKHFGGGVEMLLIHSWEAFPLNVQCFHAGTHSLPSRPP